MGGSHSIGHVGIVGCGVISRTYVDRMRAFPEIELVACADLEPERAQDLAAHAAGSVQALTPGELLASPAVDTVLNLTVPIAHADVTRAALSSSKHVYSEKPLALDVATATELVGLARDRGLRLGCAPDTFLGAGLQTCRQVLDSGVIGEPLAANALFLGAGPESWHPRPQVFYQPGAGPLLDVGVYYVTALVALLGPVASVTGRARISRARRLITSEPLKGTWMDVTVPTHVVVALDHASGVLSTLVASFDVPASNNHWIEIYGAEGTLAVPDPNRFGGTVRIRRRGETEWTEVPLTHDNATESRGIGLRDMVQAEREGRPHRASGDLALHVLEVMERSIDSSDAGRMLEIVSRVYRPEPLSAAASGGADPTA
jgi:predicted dehydrogenase